MKVLGLFLALGASLVLGAPAPNEPSTYLSPPYYDVLNYYPGHNNGPLYDRTLFNEIHPEDLAYPSLMRIQLPVQPMNPQKLILEVDDGIDENCGPSLESTPHPNDDDESVNVGTV